MVSAHVSGSSGLSSRPGRRHCVVFLGRHFILTVPLSKMATGELRGNPMMDYHPIQGGVEVLLVAPCYRNTDKFRLDGPLCSYEDLTIVKSAVTQH